MYALTQGFLFFTLVHVIFKKKTYIYKVALILFRYLFTKHLKVLLKYV